MNKEFLNGSLVFTADDGSTLTFSVHPETREAWKSEAEAMAYPVDTSKFAFSPPPKPAEPPTVSPVEFKLLFTSAERIKLKELRPTDPILDDFWSIVDDPRATQIRLGLTSTQQGVGHAIQQLVAAGTIAAEDEATRIEEILSGVMQ